MSCQAKHILPFSLGEGSYCLSNDGEMVVKVAVASPVDPAVLVGARMAAERAAVETVVAVGAKLVALAVTTLAALVAVGTMPFAARLALVVARLAQEQSDST